MLGEKLQNECSLDNYKYVNISILFYQNEQNLNILHLRP